MTVFLLSAHCDRTLWPLNIRTYSFKLIYSKIPLQNQKPEGGECERVVQLSVFPSSTLEVLMEEKPCEYSSPHPRNSKFGIKVQHLTPPFRCTFKREQWTIFVSLQIQQIFLGRFYVCPSQR